MNKNYFAPGANYYDHHKELTINGVTNAADLVRAFMSDETPRTNNVEPEDVSPIDTSFFGTDKYPADVCEKNLREAINGATGKADACRRIMTADTCGYIHIRQLSDARKAELVNPFSEPKYTFTGQDFCQARNRK